MSLDLYSQMLEAAGHASAHDKKFTPLLRRKRPVTKTAAFEVGVVEALVKTAGTAKDFVLRHSIPAALGAAIGASVGAKRAGEGERAKGALKGGLAGAIATPLAASGYVHGKRGIQHLRGRRLYGKEGKKLLKEIREARKARSAQSTIASRRRVRQTKDEIRRLRKLKRYGGMGAVARERGHWLPNEALYQGGWATLGLAPGAAATLAVRKPKDKE